MQDMISRLTDTVRSWRSRVYEYALNGLTLAVAICVVTMTVRLVLIPKSPPTPPDLAIGAPVPLSGVLWKAHPRTLLVVMQVGCKYCEASARFYQSLLTRSPSAVHIIAVFPNGLEEASAYLQARRLTFPEIAEGNFDALKVPGTPTIYLVDSSGHLAARWIGKLSGRQEREVFTTLGVRETNASLGTAPASPTGDVPTAEDLTAIRTRRLTLVDIRTRREFSEGHLAGAVNIPSDELNSRAVHEIPSTLDSLVYCNHQSSSCSTAIESQGIKTPCEQSEDYMRSLGLKRFRVIHASLSELVRAGAILSPRTEMLPQWRFLQ